MVLVKICGITNLTDALACVAAGADMLGFNFYKKSPRYVAPHEARRLIEQLPPSVLTVGVFVNEASPGRVVELSDLAGVSAVQLHGDETPEYCRALEGRFIIKALRVTAAFAPERAVACGGEAVLLDTFVPGAYGGTGQAFDWAAARATRELIPKLFLAGGLGPENVAEAVAMVRPYAVDACSSLESARGLKDEQRVRAFILAARGAGADGAVMTSTVKEG